MAKEHIQSIDGLRAVSVTAVFVYHSQLAASGGFLAVSQFFTLSGFLVTSILLGRAAENDLAVVPFWAQRYRRLMPASLLTLAAIVVFGFTLATRQQIDALQESVPAALLQVVNWHFIVGDVSYVDRFSSPSPIQHFWSLAIEEQFYLVIPLCLLGIFKLTSSPRALLTTLTAMAIASTVWMYVLFDTGSALNRVYFGTDTRASEMLLGCVLAVALHYWRPTLSATGQSLLGAAGAIAFAATTWAFFGVSLNDAQLYQGGLFVYSVLTCVVIYSLVERVGPLSHLLATKPLPGIGRLTYAIYLFHWPLMLVLTEDRVGLTGWPLLALHAALTLVLAAVSGRLLETPIRYRRPTPGNHRVAIAMLSAGVIIFVGSAALRWDNTESELAGLGEAVAEAPPISDSPVTAVIIVDNDGRATTDQIVDSQDLEVVARLHFPCEPSASNACGINEWANVISAHDPDVVLFHVSRWEPPSTMDLSAELSSGFDELSKGGAVVAWTQIVGNDIFQRANDPFLTVMKDLTSRRADMRRLRTGEDPAAVASDLVLYARRPASQLPRVLIIGDSVSRTLGYGLERWGQAEGTAVFWAAGTEGCGLVRAGTTFDATGRERPFPPTCTAIETGWGEQLAQFDPDVVLVLSNAVDFQERQLADWTEPLQPGSPVFDDWLVDEYLNTIDIAASSGARVVWIQPVCALDVFSFLTEPDGENAVDPERIAHINDVILPRLLEERPELRTVDLRDHLCVEGEPLIEIDGVGVIRPDGVHFNSTGSLWLAETHGIEILQAATS